MRKKSFFLNELVQGYKLAALRNKKLVKLSLFGHLFFNITDVFCAKNG